MLHVAAGTTRMDQVAGPGRIKPTPTPWRLAAMWWATMMLMPLLLLPATGVVAQDDQATTTSSRNRSAPQEPLMPTLPLPTARSNASQLPPAAGIQPAATSSLPTSTSPAPISSDLASVEPVSYTTLTLPTISKF